MAYRIISPQNSFVQFGGSDIATSCNYRDIPFCLPVFEEEDIYFQFVIEADSIEETDALCDLQNELLTVGISGECPGPFIHQFTEKPDRFRISDFQVLYNWSHGLPGIFSVVHVGDCFFIRVEADELLLSDCSNCLQRIGSNCHTSVLEYGNEDNFAGFNYCNSAGVDSGGEVDCSPTFVSFTNAATLTIPYTAAMQAKYGNIPTLKAWLYDTNGNLVNMSVSQSFDAYPPTQLMWDFGGIASGIIKIS
jgi:hypothetical protein